MQLAHNQIRYMFWLESMLVTDIVWTWTLRLSLNNKDIGQTVQIYRLIWMFADVSSTLALFDKGHYCPTSELLHSIHE